MRLVLIRHGITELNKRNLINGSLDEPLLPESYLQINKIVESLPKDLTHIYSSTMMRCRQTADELNKLLKLPITYHSEIVERSFGEMNGLSWEEGEKKYGVQFSKERDFSLEYDYTSLGGESISQVQERVEKFLEFVRNNPTGEPVLVVTHGGIIRCIVQKYAGELIRDHDNLYIREVNI